MPTERYIIEIQERGSDKVKRNISDIGKTSEGTAGSVNLLKRALALFGGALAIRKIVEFSDSVVNLRNRLSLLNITQAETALATEKLFDIAAETRSEFDVTAQVYSRTALAARGLGFSQSQLLTVTKALNQSVILSGTNSREAANGLIQLSQAIASNRLGGDELRSTLEQLPLVTDIIGKELVRLGLAVAGTRGEVRQLGFEGKITSEIIINALLRSAEELEKQFAATTPTISQALTVLGVRFAKLVADFNSGTGAAGAVAQAILKIAANLSTVVRVVAGLSLSSAFVAAQAGIASVVGLIGGIPAVIAAAAGLLVTFSDKITLTADGAVKLSDVLKTGFDVAKISILTAVDAITFFLSKAGDLIRVFGSFFGIVGSGRDSIDLLRTAFVGAIDGIVAAIDFLANKITFGLIPRGAVQEAVGNIKELVRVNAEVRKQAEEIAKRERVAADAALKRASERAAKVPTKQEQDRAKELAKITREIQAQIGLQGLSNRQAEIANDLARINERIRKDSLGGLPLTQKESADVRALLEAAQAAKDYNAVLNELRGPQETFAARQAAINSVVADFPELTDKAVRALRDERIALLEAETSAAAGFERGFLRLQNEITDFAGQAENVLTSSFSSAEDALVELVNTGKASFSDLFNTLQSEITRLAIRQAILAPIINALGIGGGAGAGGGISGLISSGAGALGGLFGGGGAAPAGAQNGADFRVGGSGGTDSQLVAFRATPGERVMVQTPAQQAGSQGRPVVVNFNVQTPDVTSFQRSQSQLMAQAQAQLLRAGRRNT